MPKGEKPKGPQLLPVAEVARRLRVEPSQVEAWLQKDQLRGGDAGIRPYDFKKFQLDFPEEIKRAQQEAVQEKTNKTKQKPKKGFLSKFKSIFGGGKEDEGGGGGQLAQENQRLKAELQKLQKNKSPGKGSSSKEMEEKIRFLEKQASESRALEAEVVSLKKQLADQPSPTGMVAPLGGDQSLQREVEEMRHQLAEAKRVSEQGERFREALRAAQQERDELLATIENLRQGASGETAASSEELHRLQQTVAEREQALIELEQRAQQVFQENEQLRQVAEQASAQAPQPQEDPLVAELLAVQKVNLARFKRLHDLHLQAQKQAGSAIDQQELETLRAKYEALLKNQGSGEEQKGLLEKLSEYRVFITQVKEQNRSLKEQLQSSQSSDDSRVEELEAKLREALKSGSSHQQMEAELNSLRKAMESKENQIQKVASRLADNEKRLAKAMQESARLTELLIERENRLREVSEEYEQEYRDKLENLDRQVSGLQWKLSLREERIAHLESELQRKG